MKKIAIIFALLILSVCSFAITITTPSGCGIWINTGPLAGTQVHSLVVFNGSLYGGIYNGCYVYRYDGETTWTSVGRLSTDAVCGVYSLAVLNGTLYAGISFDGYVYRYDGGTTWTSVGRLGKEYYVNSLVVFNGSLYGGTYSGGFVYRYDGGTNWTSTGKLGTEEHFVYSLVVVVYSNLFLGLLSVSRVCATANHTGGLLRE